MGRWHQILRALAELQDQVLLHINANEAHIDHKINQGDTCYVENGKFLSREVARQLACDTHLRVVLEDDDGKVLDIENP